MPGTAALVTLDLASGLVTGLDAEASPSHLTEHSSGSWVSAAPLMTFPVTGRSSGSSWVQLSLSTRMTCEPSVPHALVVAFRAPPPNGFDSRQCASHGIHSLVFPRFRLDPPCPLHEAEAPIGDGIRPPSSRSAHVVSHHLDGFLQDGLPGLLHPGSGRGSHRFCDCLTRSPGPSSAFPMRTHPSKNSPRRQPYRITAAIAFLSFTYDSHASRRHSR